MMERLKIVFCLVCALMLGVGSHCLAEGKDQVIFHPAELTHTNEKLDNPDRGFYPVAGYVVRNYYLSPDFGAADDAAGLIMFQINLHFYTQTEITDQGLTNIERALEELIASTKRRLIVRILYDWDGKASEWEPASLALIMRHMTQLAPILNRHKEAIFVVQGLFYGNWGEMNGSKYGQSNNIRLLAITMNLLLDHGIFMAVRTPCQWRIAEGSLSTDRVSVRQSMASRLSLYNDGMLGNNTDCGTYGSSENAPYDRPWCREEEICFQSEICRYVPNGGEVIMDNPYNDFDRAIADLSRMHVTYLNREYDQAVFEKWANVMIDDGSCFDGLNGFEYIERHLGYRYYIDRVDGCTTDEGSPFCVQVQVANEGFAPIYTDVTACWRVLDEEGKEVFADENDVPLRSLYGMSASQERANVSLSLETSMLPSNSHYSIWLQLVDAHGNEIKLANHQTEGADGIMVGELVIER